MSDYQTYTTDLDYRTAVLYTSELGVKNHVVYCGAGVTGPTDQCALSII